MNNTLQFGTDGIRGKSDEFPFTSQALAHLGRAIAQWSFEKYDTNRPRVLIGHDTRESCDRIKKELEMGLCSLPIDIVDGEVLPTPAVLQVIHSNKSKFDFGIVISASHNPYTDNGIKLFDAKTGKLSPDDEACIVKKFYELYKPTEELTRTAIPQGNISLWKEARSIYLDNLLSHFSRDCMRNLGPYGSHCFVIDCANGATTDTALSAFLHLTEGTMIIGQGSEPDGKNINDGCGATHPEFLQELVLGNKANIGFAFDGDGDRVIAVNRHGQIKDGDDLLAILLQHPDFQNESKVVGTVMTNHGFEKYLGKNNRELIRTKVGDKYVSAKMQEENILLGGEASGHIIMRNYLPSGDGLFVALKVLESVILNDNWDMRTFTKTPQILINVPIAKKDDLTKQPYKTIITTYKEKLLDGRIVVRYSGTENLLRVMVEDTTQDSAQSIAQHVSQELRNALHKNI